MRSMSNICSSLESIDLSPFITLSLGEMNYKYMFKNCSSLKSIDLSSFKYINKNVIGFMFDGCSSLKSIDFFSLNPMFVDCIVDYFSLKGNIIINNKADLMLKQLKPLEK